MMTSETIGVDERWRRYAVALLASMQDVRSEVPEDAHPVLMETADYWLSVGLVVGLEQPNAARTLLEIVEPEEGERAELVSDADAFASAIQL